MAMTAPETRFPEVGQAVQVRNRLATVRAVEPYDTRGQQGRLHIVEVEYLDDCRYPESEQVLWEVEATAKVLGSTSLPSVDANNPDSPLALQSFVNAHRWTRLNRLRETNDIRDEPILGVWNSAIQVHPYQLEPVIRALAMPRVSLLLADGVGLGKTIQAGLVLEELLLRRRIRRVLVLCPAMLQRQWKIELQRKFNLNQRERRLITRRSVRFRNRKPSSRKPSETANVVSVLKSGFENFPLKRRRRKRVAVSPAL